MVMPGTRRGATALMAVVRHFGVFVQLPAGAVAHELADDGEAGVLAVALHGIANVADAVAGHSLLDALIQSSLGHIQQALCFQIDLAHRIGAGIVAVEAIDLCAGIDADDITGTNDDVMRRDTMMMVSFRLMQAVPGKPYRPLKLGMPPCFTMKS